MSRLQSSDFEEDALIAMNASNLNWLMLVGSHENATTFHSGLDRGGCEQILKWCDNGQLVEYVREHILKVMPEC